MSIITFDHQAVVFDDWKYDFDGRLLGSVENRLQTGVVCALPVEKAVIQTSTEKAVIQTLINNGIANRFVRVGA